MKKLLLILAILSLLAAPVWAANAVTVTGKFVSIVPDGSTTYDYGSYGTLLYILFYPSAANDVLVVRNGGASGAEILRCISIDGGALKLEVNTAARPYIKMAAPSECTFGTPANVRIVLAFK